MQQLNFELIEYFGVWLEWIRENNIPIPDKEKFYSMVSKTRSLIHEIYSASTNQKINRRKVTPSGTDEDETEPYSPLFKV